MHEYQLLADGYERKQRIYWEVARWEMWQHTMLSPDIKPFNKPRTPQKLCSFPWDEIETETITYTPPTQGEIDALKAMFEEIKKRNG